MELPINNSEINTNNNQSQPSKNLAYLLLVVLIILIIGVIWVIASNKSKPTTVTISKTVQLKPAVVSLTSNGFVPKTLSIKLNQSVIWTNNSSAIHLVATDPYPVDNGIKGFKSGNLNPNDTYSFVFSKTGTYTYHDDLNPYNFKGVIVVKN